MMKKTELLGFIGKYSLGGNVESVTWKSNADSILTDFVSIDTLAPAQKNLLLYYRFEAVDL